MNRLSVLVVLLMVLSQAAYCQEDLLNFLIEQNEAAREKIKTAEYKVKWTVDDETKEGLRHDEAFGEVKMKGDWRFSTQELNASIPSTGWKQKQSQSMVINDKYLAYWPKIGNPYIYQDDHQSLKELSDEAKHSRMLHTTPDISSFNVVFGGERNVTFKEMMKLHPDEIRWTAEETKQSNGDSVYLIKRYSPFMNDPAKPDGVWTIDPQKGFLVTQSVFYNKVGNVWVTRKTEPKEINSGIWLPVSYQEHRYGKTTDLQASTKPKRSISIQLEDISVNNEIADDHFVLESILPEEHRESTTLFRKGLDGDTEAYVHRNGGYILREVWHSLDHLEATTMRDLADNASTTIAKKQENLGQSQPQVIKNDQTSPKEVSIPLPVKNDGKRLTYVLVGLSVIVVLVIFLSKFGRQILKGSPK